MSESSLSKVGATAIGTNGLPFANALSTALSTLSAADRAGISGLSISDMREWCTAKANECNQSPLAILAIHNILAAIHRLPPEILSRIFIEAWHDRRSLRLSHVCRIWRSILLDASEFWAVAISGDQFRLPSDNREVSDEDYLGVVCLRSAARNISLRLPSLSFRGHLHLIQLAARLTSIQVFAHTHDQLKLLWTVMHAGMPRLENLAIRVPDSITEWAVPIPLSSEHLPCLTRLELPARLFRPSWPNTLREIALRSHHGNTESDSAFFVPLQVVLRTLEGYPRLRVLDIRDNALFHYPGSHPPSRAFPKLELLRMRSHAHIVSAMLSLLSFPSSTRLRIGVLPTRLLPRVPQTELFPPGSAVDAVVALLDRITISAGGPASTIRGFVDGSERLHLTTTINEEHRILRLFERTNAPISHLLLAQHPSQRMPATFVGRSVFRTFIHLTHFTLHARIGVCAATLRVLCPPAEPSHRDPVLLPHLKDLTIGVATQRRSEISTSLRRGDLAQRGIPVTTHFRECCRLFPRVLDARQQRGLRLSRLEFFSYEEGCMDKPDSVVSHVDLAAFERDLVECEVGLLRGLVDGPVVFSGYRFFRDA